MPPKRLPNRINTPKKRAVQLPPSVARTLGKIIKILFFLIVGGAVLYFGGSYVYKLVSESYKPNAQLFQACKGSFIQIKTKPSYGMVFEVEGDTIKRLYLTAPDGATSIKSIRLEQNDWVPVYFSNNFSNTQVGEFLHLSKLEKGAVDYCYIIEQLSLTSGVPIEYVIVNDKSKGLSSSVSIAQSQEILSQVEHKTPKTFNSNILQLRALDDGTEVKVITYDAFTEQLPSFFRIDEIAQEQAFVEVYNATDIDGYASIFSRKWTMLGIDVSRVGNAAPEQVENAMAVIYLRDETKYSRTVAMIKNSFPNGKVVVRTGRPTSLVTTGDIVVFLLKR